MVGGKARKTTSLVGEIDAFNGKATWMIDQTPPTLANDSINQVIAMEFSEQGEGEHASVASFARHTLQLLNIGAPSELLMSSQKAAIDEVRHAKMCYGLAAAFFGLDVQLYNIVTTDKNHLACRCWLLIIIVVVKAANFKPLSSC